MSTYAVGVATVAAQGDRTRGLADELAAVRVGPALALVGGALPGAAAGPTADAAGAGVDLRLRQTHEVLAVLAGSLVVAAEDYDACERAATVALGGGR